MPRGGCSSSHGATAAGGGRTRSTVGGPGSGRSRARRLSDGSIAATSWRRRSRHQGSRGRRCFASRVLSLGGRASCSGFGGRPRPARPGCGDDPLHAPSRPSGPAYPAREPSRSYGSADGSNRRSQLAGDGAEGAREVADLQRFRAPGKAADGRGLRQASMGGQPPSRVRIPPSPLGRARLVGRTALAPVAQLDRASVYGTEGQRFESSRARLEKPCSAGLFLFSGVASPGRPGANRVPIQNRRAPRTRGRRHGSADSVRSR